MLTCIFLEAIFRACASPRCGVVVSVGGAVWAVRVARCALRVAALPRCVAACALRVAAVALRVATESGGRHLACVSPCGGCASRCNRMRRAALGGAFRVAALRVARCGVAAVRRGVRGAACAACAVRGAVCALRVAAVALRVATESGGRHLAWRCALRRCRRALRVAALPPLQQKAAGGTLTHSFCLSVTFCTAAVRFRSSVSAVSAHVPPHRCALCYVNLNFLLAAVCITGGLAAAPAWTCAAFRRECRRL